MNPQIIGLGWVTPLGRDVETVYQRLENGELPMASFLPEAANRQVFRIEPDLIKDITALPRLRRSSAISHFAVAAAQDAIAQAGLTEDQLARTTLIFAASDGGVVYTRRFYGDVVEHGLGSGSPLLFPETVYNAPASHVAGTAGLSGEVLTLVGDSATALSAIQMAVEAFHLPGIDYCLVVAAQEMDWISAEVYDRWKLIHGSYNEAAFFAEGAAAVVIARETPGVASISFSHPGLSYGTNQEAERSLGTVFSQIPQQPDLIISSASGTRFDLVETQASEAAYPGVASLQPKKQLGDALAATALQQVILGALFAQKGSHHRVLVPVAGFNGQASALLLTAGAASPKDNP